MQVSRSLGHPHSAAIRAFIVGLGRSDVASRHHKSVDDIDVRPGLRSGAIGPGLLRLTAPQSSERKLSGAGNGSSNVSGFAPTAEALPKSSATTRMPDALTSPIRTRRSEPFESRKL